MTITKYTKTEGIPSLLCVHVRCSSITLLSGAQKNSMTQNEFFGLIRLIHFLFLKETKYTVLLDCISFSFQLELRFKVHNLLVKTRN